MSAGGGVDFGAIVPEGYQFPSGQDRAGLLMSRVDENFFETMGVSIVRGRGFLSADTAATPRVAVINELAAQHSWPGQDPIGKRFRLDDRNGPWVEIWESRAPAGTSRSLRRPLSFSIFPTGNARARK
jgi:hypothetical protein